MAVRTNAKQMMDTLQAQIDEWQKRKVDMAEFQYVMTVTQTNALIEILYQLETLNAKTRI